MRLINFRIPAAIVGFALIASVTIELATAADTNEPNRFNQGQCSNWVAQLDRMPGPNRQPTLNVTGTCTFSTDGHSVKLVSISGPRPLDLTLRLQRIVTLPASPTAQVESKEAVTYTERTNTLYNRVLIVPDKTSIPVEKRL